MKEREPILLTDPGTDKDSIPVMPLKASSSISTTLYSFPSFMMISGITTFDGAFWDALVITASLPLRLNDRYPS